MASVSLGVISVLTAWAAATCYENHLAAAFSSITPLVPLSLLANEALWVAEAWKLKPMKFSPIYGTAGIRVFGVAAFTACSVCGASMLIHPSHSPAERTLSGVPV